MIKVLTISTIVLSLLLFAGGPPSRGTDKDQRLKANNPNAGKPKIVKPQQPKPPKKG